MLNTTITTFNKISLLPHKEKAFNLADSIITMEKIINSILNYTKKTLTEKRFTPSLFDLPTFSVQNDDTDSDSENEIMTLDKIELNDFLLRSISYLNFDTNLIVLSMMMLDKILKKGFVLTEKNVHK